MTHECREGYNRCFGLEPMVFEAWFMDKDGTECYYDNWVSIVVIFCPICGLKAENDEWKRIK